MSASSLITLELGFPADLDLDAVTRFVRSLTIRPNDRRFAEPQPLVFELVANHRSIVWRILCTDRQRSIIEQQLRAHLPSVGVTELNDVDGASHVAASESEGGEAAASPRLGIELRLSQHGRALRSDVAPELSAGLLAVLQDLRARESVTVQWLLGPPLPRRVIKPTPESELKRPRPLIEELSFGERFDSEQVRARNQKMVEPVFGALGRVAVQAATQPRRKALVTSVLGQLRLTSQPSAHLLARSFWNRWTLSRLDRVVVPMIEWPCSLNAEEFAALLAWPLGGPVAAGVSYSGHRQLPFAESLLVNPSAIKAATQLDDQRHSGFRILGEASYPGRPGLVSLAARDALQHLHVVGPTGVGKSTLLANLVAQDIAAGRAVVIIEPKGDLVADVLDRIPDSRLDDVVRLDPADGESAVGVNVFAGRSASADTSVDALVHLLKTTFAGSWGPRTQDVLHAALLTLARQPGMTLVELPLLLTDETFRRRLTKAVASDVALGPFWRWYESLSDGERSQVISPVLNKIRPFIMRPSVRRIVGQAKPTFDLLDVFTKRRILLVPLQRGVIGPETANLLASMIVAQLWQATQARASVDPSKRHPVMVYLDEFQSYLHLPTELDDVLAQARGLGVGLTLAHQHLGQLTDPAIKSGVMMNARSRIVFQSGEGDAKELARSLGSGLTAADIEGLGAYQAYARLMSGGSSTAAGSFSTLPLSDSLGSAGEARRRSRERFARPASEVDEEIQTRSQPPQDTRHGGGRRRAS